MPPHPIQRQLARNYQAICRQRAHEDNESFCCCQRCCSHPAWPSGMRLNTSNKRRYLDIHLANSGADWIARILNGHPQRCAAVLGMSIEAFNDLHDQLINLGLLRNSKHVAASEKLALTLWILRTGNSQRQTMEIIQHSMDTISKYVWARDYHSNDAESPFIAAEPFMRSSMPYSILSSTTRWFPCLISPIFALPSCTTIPSTPWPSRNAWGPSMAPLYRSNPLLKMQLAIGIEKVVLRPMSWLHATSTCDSWLYMLAGRAVHRMARF